jgi:UDP-2,3-diacylglucosamine hydrolase
MKKVFTNPFSNGFSDGCIRSWRKTGAIPVRKNKLISGDEDVTFLGEDNEWLILYSKRN